MKTAVTRTLLPLFLGIAFLINSAQAQSPVAGGSTLTWSDPQPLTDDANAPYGATRPVLAADPTGQKLIVAFNRQMSPDPADNDPWFARSINGGANWFVGKIHASAANSLQLSLTVDANATAHAAWREGNGIAISAESSWGNQPPFIISNLQGTPGANNPVIVASQHSSHIDLVWSSGDNRPPNIVTAFSNDFGKTWSFGERTVMDSPASSLFPAAAIDDNDQLHLVWEEHDGKPIPGQAAPGRIYYSMQGPGGWSSPIVISPVSNALNAQRPAIIVTPAGLRVSYTVRIDGTAEEPNLVRQWVHEIECEAACTSFENWISAENPISGPALQSNQTEPYNIVSTLGSRHGCTLAYFHGIDPTLNPQSELILGANSCRNWAADARDQVTTPDAQALFPSLQVIQNWSLAMAYQSGTERSQIYLITNRPDAYLPIIKRR